MLFDAVERGREVSKSEYKKRQVDLRVDLVNAQFELKSEDFSVLILLAGDDREGLAELMDLTHEWLDTRLLHTGVFAERLPEEAEYPIAWRYWRAMQPRGSIGVFYGGWVLGPIVDRMLKRISKQEYERRVDYMVDAERMLSDDGMLILKFWLHIPKKQLKKRLRSTKKREQSWRLLEIDQAILERYDDLVELGQKLVGRTNTAHSPWIVVESTDDQYRNLTVMETIQKALADRLTAPPSEEPRAEAQLEIPTQQANVLDAVDLSQQLPKDEYDRRLHEGQERLAGLSLEARDKGVASVLVFEGWDAGGKGGAIRRLTSAMAAQNYRVIPIAAPSDEERARHYLWRFWRRIPRNGHVTIFDRSWYGRVLVERVEGFASEAEWRRAYHEIVAFEAQLVQHGMVVRKFWMHIDREEQLRRFQARETTRYKKHKITDEDYRNREKWGEYEEAVQEMVVRTHTDSAPWILVPANDKRHARITVLEEVCAGLEAALP